MAKNDSKQCVVYGRVSSHKQLKRGDLKRQVEDLTRVARESHHVVYKTYRDIGSGLNQNRKGLWHLIRDARKGLFSTVYVSFKDRLTRFGFKYLERYLAEFNVSVNVVNSLDEKRPESELVEDMVAIIHSFSGKLYRMRRNK